MEKEVACGFVAVYRAPDTDLFLLVEQEGKNGKRFWGFPKGHPEGNESPLEAARRELAEETGITEFSIVPEIVFTESYPIMRDGTERLKENTLFLCFVPELAARPQEGEIFDCRFLDFDAALAILGYESRKRVLVQARDALAKIPRTGDL